MDRAVVVGGGIIGGAVALALLQRGFAVTVVDRGVFGGEASRAAAGMLCPGAEILDAEGPTEIFTESLNLYRSWVAEIEAISGLATQYQATGMLRLVFSDAEEDSVRKRLATRKVPGQWLTADQARGLEPWLGDNLKGAICFDHDAEVHPVALLRALKTAIIRLGGTILEGVSVHGFLQQGLQVQGVRTTTGTLGSDIAIVAAGAWSTALLADLEVNVPVTPVKGQMLAVSLPKIPVQHVIQGPGGMILPRRDGSLHVGVTIEPMGYDQRPTARAIHDIYQAAAVWAPWLAEAEFRASWAGLRPASPDRRPYIGTLASWSGVAVATGHYGVGIFLAPITGRLIADIVTGQPSLLTDIEPYRPERYESST